MVGCLLQIAVPEGFQVVLVNAHLLVQILRNGTPVGVNDVQGVTEVPDADAHKGANYFLLLLTAAGGFHILAQLENQRTVTFVGDVKILHDGFPVCPEGAQDEGGTYAGAVFPLRAVPEHGAFFRLQDEVEEGGVLQLGEFTQDQGRV